MSMRKSKTAALTASLLAMGGWGMSAPRLAGQRFRSIGPRRPQRQTGDVIAAPVIPVKACPVKGHERNMPCPCGSGKKLKKCDCWRKPADARAKEVQS